ncbi:hypothetical protein [Actinomadura chokoriensis]|uniref:Uncharacterized protein n=1 Tax=Actinomadura chokoriensis TaxID=454156 RepID=A0ABV4R0N1_9ACTN
MPDEVNSADLPATAMVPVVQIFERDVPGPWWPADADLLQTQSSVRLRSAR